MTDDLKARLRALARIEALEAENALFKHALVAIVDNWIAHIWVGSPSNKPGRVDFADMCPTCMDAIYAFWESGSMQARSNT